MTKICDNYVYTLPELQLWKMKHVAFAKNLRN